MLDAHAFLQTLALVLCVAALTTVVFQRLHQPVVFGYLLAGMIVGPHLPIPLVADEAMVRMLAELGVILLMFSLGLEFSFGRLFRIGPTAGLIAVPETGAMVWIGFVIAQLFGWTTTESIYAGAIIAISSTTIIVKAFEEQQVRGRFTEIVKGVLIVEDLIAILLLAILSALSAGTAVSAATIGATVLRLVVFLAGLIGVGLLIVPRAIRAVVRMQRAETTIVASVGICFAAALLALNFGYSVALGAFIAGSLIAESGEEKTVETLVRPLRDVFAAIFFVAVGMLLDPRLVLQHWGIVLTFTIAVIVGKVVAVSVSTFLSGSNARTSVQTGMSLAQIGEFSFIIAGLGLATGATKGFLYPVAVAVSAITTLTTPWLIRAAGPVATYVDRRLPRPLQTFASLYGSWIDRLRTRTVTPSGRFRVRRLVRLVLLDAALIAVLVIAGAVEHERLTSVLGARFGTAPAITALAIVIGLGALALPLVIGLMRTSRALGQVLAVEAFPPPAAAGGVDMAMAPRRALVVALQLGIVGALGVMLVAVTQPFLPTLRPALVLLVVMAVLVVSFWRNATNLQGHARAGAEVIALALAKGVSTERTAQQIESSMEPVRRALPGLGEPVSLRIVQGSPAASRTLAQIDLRGLTGATVLAILRDGEQIPIPSGHDTVRVGDVLALAGSLEAIAAASALLEPPDAALVPSPADA